LIFENFVQSIFSSNGAHSRERSRHCAFNYAISTATKASRSQR
jgi:hypothetical protein